MGANRRSLATFHPSHRHSDTSLNTPQKRKRAYNFVRYGLIGPVSERRRGTLWEEGTLRQAFPTPVPGVLPFAGFAVQTLLTIGFCLLTLRLR